MATDTVAAPGVISTDKSKVYKNFIDGEWVESSTGETFENRNPADTREVVGIFQKSNRADVNAAVTNVEGCKGLTADAQTFNKAATNRRTRASSLRPGRASTPELTSTP